MNKHLFLIFIAVVTFCSCAPNGNTDIITPTDLSATIGSVGSPIITPAKITPTPVATLTPLSPESTVIMITATSSPIPSSTREMNSPRVCSSPPQSFNFREALGINLVRFRFENEHLITFEGWTNGPDPIVTPITPEPTPDFFPGPYIYSRRLPTGGQLSLPEGKFSLRSLDFEPLLNNPCGEVCPIEIIGQSPKRDWQLVQVHDWLVEKSGIWLVSKNEMVRLVPYITSLQWQWANDNSLLWLVYNDPELGGYTLVAQLSSPVILRGAGTQAGGLPDLLIPWPYIVAFSPVDKISLSTTSFEFPNLDTDELFTINLTDTFTQTGSTQVIPGLVTVDWNEATQSFLLQVVKDDKVEILDSSGSPLLTIPESNLESIIPGLAEGQIKLSRISNPGGYALSPGGKKLAVVGNNGEFWIFDCETG